MFWDHSAEEEMRFTLRCDDCRDLYEVVIDKRRTQIIRGLCPACLWLCDVESSEGTTEYLNFVQLNMLATFNEWYGTNLKNSKWNFR